MVIFFQKKIEINSISFQLDVELLCDVFANFRSSIYQDSMLDVAQFVSIPSLSFSTMLKEAKVSLKLISDINIFLLIEKNLRGGYCGTHKRLSVSNNSAIPYCDPSQATVIINSQDFAALYG